MPFRLFRWVSRLLRKFIGTPKPSLPDKPHFYRQEQPNTCAVACLRMVFSAYHVEVSELELASLAGTNEFGTEISGLVQSAEKLGFRCRASAMDFASLQQARYPIVYLDGPTVGRDYLMHAVVVESAADPILVLDPMVGPISMARADFCAAWEQAGSYAVVVQQHV